MEKVSSVLNAAFRGINPASCLSSQSFGHLAVEAGRKTKVFTASNYRDLNNIQTLDNFGQIAYVLGHISDITFLCGDTSIGYEYITVMCSQ